MILEQLHEVLMDPRKGICEEESRSLFMAAGLSRREHECSGERREVFLQVFLHQDLSLVRHPQSDLQMAQACQNTRGAPGSASTEPLGGGGWRLIRHFWANP